MMEDLYWDRLIVDAISKDFAKYTYTIDKGEPVKKLIDWNKPLERTSCTDQYQETKRVSVDRSGDRRNIVNYYRDGNYNGWDRVDNYGYSGNDHIVRNKLTKRVQYGLKTTSGYICSDFYETREAAERQNAKVASLKATVVRIEWEG